MFGIGCEIVCVIAASGGAASGKEDDDLARKSAVEAGATILVGNRGLGGRFGGAVSLSTDVAVDGAAIVVVGAEGPEGIGPGHLSTIDHLRRPYDKEHTDICEETGSRDTKLEKCICDLYCFSFRLEQPLKFSVHTSQAEYASKACICSTDILLDSILRLEIAKDVFDSYRLSWVDLDLRPISGFGGVTVSSSHWLRHVTILLC
jgi:hypothetical protein